MAKLLMFTSLARTVYDQWRLNQVLFSLAIVASVTVVVAVVIGAAAVVGFQAMHAALLASGSSALTAILVVLGFAAIIVVLLLFIVSLQIQRVRGLLRVNKPVNKACEIIDAFLDGLTDR